MADDRAEVIGDDEEPMTPREIERAFAGIIPRSRRRELIRALKLAGLIVFRADP